MGQTKYYTISEVAELLDISQTSLRYLEKTISRLKVRKIRGRRYYTGKNIDILRDKMSNQYKVFSPTKPPSSESKSNVIGINVPVITNILHKITNLEQKFTSLRNRLL